MSFRWSNSVARKSGVVSVMSSGQCRESRTMKNLDNLFGGPTSEDVTVHYDSDGGEADWARRVKRVAIAATAPDEAFLREDDMRRLAKYLWRCPCPNSRLLLGSLIYASGAKNYKVMCSACGRWGGAVAKGNLSRAMMEAAPVMKINNAGVVCERCGSPGVENHHWAPRSLFDDADLWPTAPLCRGCHARWHDVIRHQARLPIDARRTYWADESSPIPCPADKVPSHRVIQAFDALMTCD
jgi:hypothetical protein